jgi:hypothetical protein
MSSFNSSSWSRFGYDVECLNSFYPKLVIRGNSHTKLTHAFNLNDGATSGPQG